jgi:hypothetical protein
MLSNSCVALTYPADEVHARIHAVAVRLINIFVRSIAKTAVFGPDSAFRNGALPYDFARFRHQEATGDAPHSSENRRVLDDRQITQQSRISTLCRSATISLKLNPASDNHTEHHPSSRSPILILIAALSHPGCRATRRTTSSTSDGPVGRVGSGDARDIAVGK